MSVWKTELAVIGGGAAGLFAAAAAAEMGVQCALIEPNRVMGRKLRITGKGRCNLTNNCDLKTLMDNIPVNPRVLYGAFSRFGPEEVMAFFEDAGVPLKTERGNRVFPISDSANQIADTLERLCRERGVEFINKKAEDLLIENGSIAGVTFRDGKILCRKVILATGGMSYPATGSRGDGYRMAEKLGHTIVPVRPSLVPLCCEGNICQRLQGLSLKNVKLKILENDKELFEDFGEMLFTHFGISGPLVLSASAHMRHMGELTYRAVIDLKPALDEQTLDQRLISDLEKHRNNDFINSLGDLLPKKLIPVITELSGIDPRLKSNSITREQRHVLLSLLKSFSLDITGFRPIDEAIISSGGVSVKEVDPKTMESKRVSNLYFAGEILDLDAYTGGFNLQIAWSTAYAAACAAAGS